ncbi:hypothetical protein BH09PAT2_BH09PAT2_06500 [soil metagenome]
MDQVPAREEPKPVVLFSMSIDVAEKAMEEAIIIAKRKGGTAPYEMYNLASTSWDAEIYAMTYAGEELLRESLVQAGFTLGRGWHENQIKDRYYGVTL